MSANSRGGDTPLADARKRLNLSQTELAERAGTTLDTIFRVEHAEHVPFSTTRRAIARALKMDPADLWPGR
jgi:transcriptional regulator with XRE-family HTH domain